MIRPLRTRAAMPISKLPAWRSTGFTASSDLVVKGTLIVKSAGQHRKHYGCRAECLSNRDQREDHSEPLDRVPSRLSANGGGPCSESPQCPSGEAVRTPPGPRAERGRASVEPRAIHDQRELHRPSADRTPSVPEPARSGRQPFTAAAAAGIDNRPPASRRHPVPKSMAPSSALNVRLISALHKFLQGRGGIVVGAALLAPPSPGVPSTLRPHPASRQPMDSVADEHPHSNHLNDNGNIVNTSL